MTDESVKLVIGSLLHDIGKVIYRTGNDMRRHSQSGYDYLKEDIHIDDKTILECVRYHHGKELSTASISDDSKAYITYVADNIASAADRREKDTAESGFEIHTAMQPVFNILNNNNSNKYYRASTLDINEGINYPTDTKESFTENQYRTIMQNVTDNLKGIDWTDEYLNSLLEVLEANLSFIPSSTSNKELADISLYDHLKLTAAIASCINEYMSAQDNKNYKVSLLQNAESFYEEKAFLLASMDISGIQKFIYTITDKNALRTLRARSFYLEIMMEHIIDLLLQELGLSRANLIYSGGGHCYLILPNTKNVKEKYDDYMDMLNQWFLEYYQISLYIAGGYVECSSNDLKNVPDGSYSDMFRRLSDSLSGKKASRYKASDILSLNSAKKEDYTRECKVCKRIHKVNSDSVCPICSEIENFSKQVLYADFFTVLVKEVKEGLPLPGGYTLVADNKESLLKKMENDDYFVRAYGKNQLCTGKHIATKIWVGNYNYEKNTTFEDFAKMAEGINRIAVLRADVDNLGHAFVAGFQNKQNNNRYVTLSRTATLSRQLSLFFKYYINHILENPKYSLWKSGKTRKAAIVYSGGDDLFIVGAWNEVIELAVDIRRDFEKYSENTLTLSAGIGLYSSGYPISVMADEVADMEDASKKLPGKNAVTLFEDGQNHEIMDNGNAIKVSDGTYRWKEFEDEVIGEKFSMISEFFETSDERGKSFLYKLLELIRNQDEKINFARYVYILSRMEPGHEAASEQRSLYDKFSKAMYQWIQNEKDRRQLKTAINIYAYLTREEEDN